LVGGTLSVEVLTEGVHSGDASGVVPSSFRILRQLLDRIEDSATGRILLPELHVSIPAERAEQAECAAKVLGENATRKYPFAGATLPTVAAGAEAVLNRTWRPALSIIGAEGLPAIAEAGNVLRPRTALKLSLRLPPTVPAEAATLAVKRLLENDPPYGATVRFDAEHGATGWNAPTTAPWLAQAIDEASSLFFKRPSAALGEGGTIPFMAMLGEVFPDAQFLITGVLGPRSNAHGPNEFLHVPYAKALTACVAFVLAAHVGA
jgi:acetylornithine deacetylase/succinyl-diaminopimelate desuccinylase-like protein